MKYLLTFTETNDFDNVDTLVIETSKNIEEWGGTKEFTKCVLTKYCTWLEPNDITHIIDNHWYYVLHPDDVTLDLE